MKKLFALLLALCLVCASSLALAKDEVSLGGLGWTPMDVEDTVLTDEVRQKVMDALKDFKDGTVEPVLVLAEQPATSSDASDIDSESMGKAEDSLNAFLQTLGTKTDVLSTSVVVGDDVCVLCHVTPKEKGQSPYWMLVYVSCQGELIDTVILDVGLNK